MSDLQASNEFILECEDSEYVLYIEDEEHSLNVDTSMGTYKHNLLINRELEDQHPIEAITGLREELDQRVVKEDGKTLIDTTLVEKLEDIDLTGVIYDENYVHTDNNFSSSYKNKIDSIEVGAQKNTVNSVNGLQGDVVISKESIGLDNVDNTRDIDKPISRSTQNALNTKLNASDLSTVGRTNDYNDLDNKPFIPTATSDLTNNSGFITNSALAPYAKTTEVNQLLDPYITEAEVDVKLLPYAETTEVDAKLIPYIKETEVDQKLLPYAKTADLEAHLTNKVDYDDLAIVATTGSYSDLSNKPNIPSNVSDLVNDEGFITAEILEPYAVKDDLARVATTGSYNDLSSKPNIPNSTSDLINDSDFITHVDLAPYDTIESVDQKLSTKQNRLTAGTNVEIVGNTINVDVPPNVLVDYTTITKSDEDIITAVGTYTKSNTIKYDWEGTLAEWEAGRADGSIPNDWFCFITDDEQETLVGPKGDSSTIEIGTVETGDTASVVNSGSETNAILDFVLPRGKQGPPNHLSVGSVYSGEEPSVIIYGDAPLQYIDFVLPKGEKGEVGPSNSLRIGEVTEGDEPSVEITGSSPNQILNFVLPKGIQGEKGEKGEKGDVGPQGEQGIQGEVGPSNVLTIGTVTKGDEASATITGGPPNQELSLVLPKGDKGDRGEDGEKGEKGETGEVGPKGDKGDDGGMDAVYEEDTQTLSFYSESGNAFYPKWGELTGDIALQVDLKNALDLKANTVDLDKKQDVGDYALKGDVPTLVSQLQNDSDYATKMEVMQAIASIPQFKLSIVDVLPETGEKMVLYLVPKVGTENDIYNEYIWIENTNTFELVGSTAVDLTNYYTKSEIDTTIGDINAILDSINGEVV